MANSNQTLSASNIKYLLVLHELSQIHSGVRCVDVAGILGISKPSVHTMMKTLKDMKIIQKDKYGEVYFTQEGRKTANEYSEYFKIVYNHFDRILPIDADVKAATCAVLSEVSRNSLGIMCKRLQCKGGKDLGVLKQQTLISSV